MTGRRILIATVIAGLVTLAAGLTICFRIVDSRKGQLATLQMESETLQGRPTMIEAQRQNEALREQLRVAAANDTGDVMHHIVSDLNSIRAVNASITNEAPEGSRFFKRFLLIVTFDGPFDGLIDFIDRNHQRKSLTRLRRMEVLRNPNETNGHLSVTMQLYAFTTELKEPR